MYKNIYMIAAITEKSQAIGKDGDMIFHIKEDLMYFKNKTSGNTIVCGSKTYLSFPKRPLPNRKNIILTRKNIEFENAIVMHSKSEVLKYAKENPNEEIFIVGGDNIYHQFIDDAFKLYITEIEENEIIEADSFFPKFDKSKYNLIYKSKYIENDNSPKYRFLIFERL